MRINGLARRAGIDHDIYPNVRALRDDTGERFFSEYLEQQKNQKQRFQEHRENQRCQCDRCVASEISLPHQQSDSTTSATASGASSPTEIPRDAFPASNLTFTTEQFEVH